MEMSRIRVGSFVSGQSMRRRKNYASLDARTSLIKLYNPAKKNFAIQNWPKYVVRSTYVHGPSYMAVACYKCRHKKETFFFQKLAIYLGGKNRRNEKERTMCLMQQLPIYRT